MVSVSLDSAGVAATEAALTGLPGFERVVAEPDALALYVEDGAGSIAEIVRRLDQNQIRVGAIAVARPARRCLTGRVVWSCMTAGVVLLRTGIPSGPAKSLLLWTCNERRRRERLR